jgi:hypothetical protein
MRKHQRIRQACALGFGAWIVVGAEASIADNASPCANIEEPFAYNACLAKQNPRAPDMRAVPESLGDGARAPSHRLSAWDYYHARNHFRPNGSRRRSEGRGQREQPP